MVLPRRGRRDDSEDHDDISIRASRRRMCPDSGATSPARAMIKTRPRRSRRPRGCAARVAAAPRRSRRPRRPQGRRRRPRRRGAQCASRRRRFQVRLRRSAAAAPQRVVAAAAPAGVGQRGPRQGGHGGGARGPRRRELVEGASIWPPARLVMSVARYMPVAGERERARKFTRKLPRSCLPRFRVSYHWRSRQTPKLCKSWPKLVQQLLKSCSRAQIRPSCGAKSAKSRRFGPFFRQF